MKLVTIRDLIRQVPERWKAQYCYAEGKWGKTMGGDTSLVYKGLAALDRETATPEQVAAIIGNGSWSQLLCNECGQNVDAIVELGQPPDHDSSTANVCVSCMYKAIALLGPALLRRNKQL